MKCGHSPYLCEKEIDKKNEKRMARPSLEQFLEMPKARDFDRNVLDTFVKQRGNSAIYVCPTSCHFVTDADIQASYWIGLKKILKENTGAKESPTVKQLVDFHKKMEIQPFSLQDSLAKS